VTFELRHNLRGSYFAIEWGRITNQRRTIDAAEGERVVSLNAMALWTALHFSGF
jgi:hypothetical protein